MNGSQNFSEAIVTFNRGGRGTTGKGKGTLSTRNPAIVETEPPNAHGCQAHPGCTCYGTDLHCIPDWSPTDRPFRLPSFAWTKANLGRGAFYAQTHGDVWGLSLGEVYAVMLWARDRGLDPTKRPGDGDKILREYERRTGRTTAELDEAVDPARVAPVGGGTIVSFVPGQQTRLPAPPSFRSPGGEPRTPTPETGARATPATGAGPRGSQAEQARAATVSNALALTIGVGVLSTAYVATLPPKKRKKLLDSLTGKKKK